MNILIQITDNIIIFTDTDLPANSFPAGPVPKASDAWVGF